MDAAHFVGCRDHQGGPRVGHGPVLDPAAPGIDMGNCHSLTSLTIAPAQVIGTYKGTQGE